MNQEQVMAIRRRSARDRLPGLLGQIEEYERMIEQDPDHHLASRWREKAAECREIVEETVTKGYVGSDAPVGVLVGAPTAIEGA